MNTDAAVDALEWLRANPAGGRASEVAAGIGMPSSWQFLHGRLTVLRDQGLVESTMGRRHALIWRPTYNCPEPACRHLWGLHADGGGCTAKVFPAHSLTGEPCPCERGAGV